MEQSIELLRNGRITGWDTYYNLDGGCRIVNDNRHVTIDQYGWTDITNITDLTSISDSNLFEISGNKVKALTGHCQKMSIIENLIELQFFDIAAIGKCYLGTTFAKYKKLLDSGIDNSELIRMADYDNIKNGMVGLNASECCIEIDVCQAMTEGNRFFINEHGLILSVGNGISAQCLKFENTDYREKFIASDQRNKLG